MTSNLNWPFHFSAFLFQRLLHSMSRKLTSLEMLNDQDRAETGDKIGIGITVEKTKATTKYPLLIRF